MSRLSLLAPWLSTVLLYLLIPDLACSNDLVNSFHSLCLPTFDHNKANSKNYSKLR